jgi:cytoskeleton protein RodZ
MMAKSLPEHSVMNIDGALDLRLLRETRGLTLDNVFQATKISVKNLEAMENGDFDRLPPPVYTRAYFISYARLLGADEKLIAAQYEKSLAVSTQAVEDEIDEIPEQHSFFSRNIIIKAIIVAILCTLGGFSYWYFNTPADDVQLSTSLPMYSKDKPKTDAMNAGVFGVPADVPAGPSVGTGDTPGQAGGLPASAVLMPDVVKNEATESDAIKQPRARPSTLIIIAQEKTWLRITEDQKEAYELLMAPGERIERSAWRFDIDIGNAGGISVQFQDNIMKTLGKSGEVVHLRLP